MLQKIKTIFITVLLIIFAAVSMSFAQQGTSIVRTQNLKAWLKQESLSTSVRESSEGVAVVGSGGATIKFTPSQAPARKKVSRSKGRPLNEIAKDFRDAKPGRSTAGQREFERRLAYLHEFIPYLKPGSPLTGALERFFTRDIRKDEEAHNEEASEELILERRIKIIEIFRRAIIRIPDLENQQELAQQIMDSLNQAANREETKNPRVLELRRVQSAIKYPLSWDKIPLLADLYNPENSFGKRLSLLPEVLPYIGAISAYFKTVKFFVEDSISKGKKWNRWNIRRKINNAINDALEADPFLKGNRAFTTALEEIRDLIKASPQSVKAESKPLEPSKTLSFIKAA